MVQDEAATIRTLQAACTAPFAAVIVDEDNSNLCAALLVKTMRMQALAAGSRVITLAPREPTTTNRQVLQYTDARLIKPLRQSQLYAAIRQTLEPARASADRPQRAAPPRAARPARILVAEDNEINQIVTTQVLSKVGFTCDLVANGKEALAALTDKTYDLVLMDCQMPEMDGFAATRQYRSQESLRDPAPSRRLPIIALTANAMAGDRERCLEAGMSDYLTKPIDPLKLIDLVQRHLDEAAQT